MKTVWKIVKIVLLSALFLAMIIIVGRVFIYSDESPLSEISSNEILRQAYSSCDDSMKDYFVKTHDVPYQISEEDGFFTAYQFTWIPSAHQIQVVVRYNTSVYKQINEKYAGDDSGFQIEEGSAFNFILVKDPSGEEYLPSYTETDSKWMYEYVRLVYDNVDVENVNDLWIEMRCEGKSDYINRLICHYAIQDSVTEFYPLSSSEKKSLIS